MKTLEINPETQKILSIKRTFNLPLNAVWKAWSEPESCKKWWGPKDYTCPHCTIDFKTGGKYLMSMQGPDGKEIWSTGTYKEIRPLKKIVLTDSFSDSHGNKISAEEVGMPGEWPPELIITVELEDSAGKTNMVLTHEGIPEEMVDDCITGWQQSFDKLETNLKR